MQYERNDANLVRGKFRVRGDTIEVHPAYEEHILRIELFGDEIERITRVDPVTGELLNEVEDVVVFPATHYVAGTERMQRAIEGIEVELQERLAYFESTGKLLEAQRLRMRTSYDLEMMAEVGSCSGIENYSRHIDGRSPGQPPYTLLDFFPKDYLLVIDESHVAVPQLHGQYHGDRSRKETLIEHGFRLPSAADNRPLRYEELMERINQVHFHVGDPVGLRDIGVQPGCGTDSPPDGPNRPRGGREADEGPNRRPHSGDHQTSRGRRQGAGDHAYQENGRGPY